MVAQAEIDVIRRFIRPGDVVFDVGANVGAWTREVLAAQPDCRVFALEPLAAADGTLAGQLARLGSRATVFPVGLASAAGTRSFTHYRTHPSFSGFHRRTHPIFGDIPEPSIIDIDVTTLDTFCGDRGVRHVNFLKIDVEGAELEVLLGARGLLRHGRIDLVQFEYGGTYADAGTRLESVFALMAGEGYRLFKLGQSFDEPLVWSPALEDFEYANYLAIHGRLTDYLFGRPPRMLDLAMLLPAHGVRPRGVVHVGAHRGREADAYRAMGAGPILFVEANPALADALAGRFAGADDVHVESCAAGEAPGRAVLHITSGDQSSSLLPLGLHRRIYPSITEVGRIEVTVRPLDEIVERSGRAFTDFNVLNMDIQGAELLALRGAPRLLEHIEAVNLEVNFAELYEGCAQIEDVEAHLTGAGFRRVAMTCPYHPTWGDALYVRVPPAAGCPEPAILD
ncbi:FkbM family methyltransferase [Azospirillum halopraeferens]|uniref:FkbM family methyltransferase n=1 Tax=Azospirillum halopraeferens TaxID=34010 RepID=UPI000412D4B7|nr:FkbM family methyltransferase [Azospirillum halopraeferens]